MKTYQNLIANQWVASDPGATLTVTNPATEAPAGAVHLASAAQVLQACDAAAKAQRAWRKTPAIVRADFMRRLADALVARKHAIGAPVRSQPVAVDGWIYVGTEDGRLVAIDTKDASLTGWPMWGGNAARTGVAAK